MKNKQQIYLTCAFLIHAPSLVLLACHIDHLPSVPDLPSAYAHGGTARRPRFTGARVGGAAQKHCRDNARPCEPPWCRECPDIVDPTPRGRRFMPGYPPYPASGRGMANGEP